MGTKIEATIMRVIDGDTLLCKVAGEVYTIRCIYTDTEECRAELRSKPPTTAGLLALDFAQQYWWNFQPVLEFDSNQPLEICLQHHRDYHDRLTCYVWRGDENYNLRLISEGLSPYFRKYGSSRFYHEEFGQAQEDAQFKIAGIWNPATNVGGAERNYIELIPYWNLRASIIDEYRALEDYSIVNAAGNCDNLCRQIRESRPNHLFNMSSSVVSSSISSSLISSSSSSSITLFCDLQGGVHHKFSRGFICRSGNKKSYISLYFPDRNIEQEITHTYAGIGRGYVYMRGYPRMYRGMPQIVVQELSDRPDFSPSILVNQDSLNPLPADVLESVRYAAQSHRKRVNNASHSQAN